MNEEDVKKILDAFVFACENGLCDSTPFAHQICQLEKDEPKPGRPKIICLCGSTRFTEQMLVKQWEFIKQGFIVVSWCALPDYYFNGNDTAHIGDQEGVKAIVDEVHLRKIDIADEVFVLNVDGYIGESTSKEIAYAQSLGKPINYLEVQDAKAQ